MTLRRLFMGLTSAALVAILAASSASAAASPEGVLRASFEAYGNGGTAASYATWEGNGNAWYHAASTGIDLGAGAVRISLGAGQEYCSSNVFGVWVIAWDYTRESMASSVWEMSFGPVGNTSPLAIQRTAVKRALDTFWFPGDPDVQWWQSIGVPVYGTLAPGLYEYTGSYLWGGEYEEWDLLITIDDC